MAQQAGGLSELAFHLQGKFDWSNLFDLIRLGHVIMTGLVEVQPRSKKSPVSPLLCAMCHVLCSVLRLCNMLVILLTRGCETEAHSTREQHEAAEE